MTHGEAGALLKVRERLLLPAVRAIAPGVVDMHLPALGGLHRYAFVSIRKTLSLSSPAGGQRPVGLGGAAVHEVSDPGRRRRRRARTSRACWPKSAPTSIPSATCSRTTDRRGRRRLLVELLSRHLGIDATTKIAGERSAPAPERLAASEEIEQLVTARWSEYKLP